MQSVHYDLWHRCEVFVSATCGTRDVSHGLAHMQSVTEGAVALCLMNMSQDKDAERQTTVLYGVILVGMLHDVADHKYDTDGTLQGQLRSYLVEEARTWLRLSPPWLSSTLLCPRESVMLRDEDSLVDTLVKQLGVCIKAISYSTEVKKGMRWFESTLPAHLVQIRDFVSDADKLEAIGTTGLMRCYNYACHRLSTQMRSADVEGGNSPAVGKTNDASTTSARLRTAAMREVEVHYKEKLERLASGFIVTKAGRFLAAPRQAAMVELLAEWKKSGPPCVCAYVCDVDALGR